jgi:hypothetical protein
MIKICYDLWNLQITWYSGEKKRKIPTKTKTKVQDLINDYHNFEQFSLNCARTWEVPNHGILDKGHATCTVFFSHYDLKGYGNSPISEKVGS